MKKHELGAHARGDEALGTVLSDAELAKVCGSALAQGRSLRKRSSDAERRSPAGSRGGGGGRSIAEPLSGWSPPAIPDPVRVAPEDDGLMGGWELAQPVEPGPPEAVSGITGGWSHGAEASSSAGGAQQPSGGGVAVQGGGAQSFEEGGRLSGGGVAGQGSGAQSLSGGGAAVHGGLQSLEEGGRSQGLSGSGAGMLSGAQALSDSVTARPAAAGRR